MSALVSPMSRSGDWQVSLHLSPSDLSSLSRILRRRKPEDVLDLIQHGERLLHSASFHPTPSHDLWRAHSEGGTLAWVLDGLQAQATAAVDACHDRVFAPAGLSASPAHSALWLQLLLAAACVGAGWQASAYLRPSPAPPTAAGAPAPARGAPLAVAAPAVGRRRAAVQARPQSMGAALWTGVLLFVLVLFVGGYVHHYHALYVDQRAHNRVLQANPPHGCFDAQGPPSLSSSLLSALQYFTKAAHDDACARWLAALDRSSYPNPLVVLSSFLSVTVLSPLPHAGEALGSFTRHFLANFSVLTQAAMMVFLLALLLGCVALCMLLGQQCVVRLGSGAGRRAQRRERLGGRRDHVRIEEVSDDESDEEDERRRVRPLRLKAPKRRDDERRVVQQQRYLPRGDAEDSDEYEEEAEEDRKEARRRRRDQPDASTQLVPSERQQRVKVEERKEERSGVGSAEAKEQEVEATVDKVKVEPQVKEEAVKQERSPVSSAPLVSPSRPAGQYPTATASPPSAAVPPPSGNADSGTIAYI